jgi:hypothetical protein
MTSPKREDPGRLTGVPTTYETGTDAKQVTDPGHRSAPARHQRVTARAFLAAPIGRRQQHALVVPTCPRCAHLHIHRAAGPHGGRRTGSCGATDTVIVAGRKRAS